MERKWRNNELNFIGCGAIHTLIVGNWRNNCAVWGFGWNGKGQLGINAEEHNKSLPIKIPSNLPKMKGLSCGGDHSILFSEEGEVFVVGSNDSGQLGLSNNFENVVVPRSLAFGGKKILLAACGSEHSLFLEDIGSLWSCGLNSHGQLGLGDHEDRTFPHLVTYYNENNIKIKSLACGRLHSMVIDEEENIWSFGSNEHGQLGLANDSYTYSTPQLIDYFTKMDIIEIACGCCHSIVIDVDGQLWAFGCNREGQLGLGDMENRNSPEKVQNFAKITKVKCGSVHSVALDEFGFVWGFGNNHLGQLGFEENELFYYPRQLVRDKFPKISSIECGAYHTVFMDVDGTFWSTGRNVGGQLGLNDVEDRFAPTIIQGLSWTSQLLSCIPQS